MPRTNTIKAKRTITQTRTLAKRIEWESGFKVMDLLSGGEKREEAPLGSKVEYQSRIKADWKIIQAKTFFRTLD
jgi:hypothetical protein